MRVEYSKQVLADRRRIAADYTPTVDPTCGETAERISASLKGNDFSLTFVVRGKGDRRPFVDRRGSRSAGADTAK